MQIIAGSSSIDLANEISIYTSWDIVVPVYKTFPDGESYLRIVNELEDEVLIIQSLGNPQDNNLFQLLNLVVTLKRLGVNRITVFTPYLAYARADREVLSGDAISSATVLQLLESTGVDHLITLDVHNPNIQQYTKIKFTNIFPIKGIQDYFHSLHININEFQIIAPDQGAIERAEIYAKAFNIKFCNLTKTRDPITGQVGVSIGNAEITSDKILLVDDIMATGSSLIQAASLIKLYNVNIIHVFITHALGTAAVDRLKEISNGEIISTNSIPSLIGKVSPVKDLVEVI